MLTLLRFPSQVQWQKFLVWLQCIKQHCADLCWQSLPNRCLCCQQPIAVDCRQTGTGARQTGLCPACVVEHSYIKHSLVLTKQGAIQNKDQQLLPQQAVCCGCGKVFCVGRKTFALYCGQCLARSSRAQLPLTVICACDYHGQLGRFVSGLKYQRQFAPLQALVEALLQRVMAFVDAGQLQLPQALLPMPLHPKKLRQRGFNQAYLIAQVIAKRLKLPIVTDVVARHLEQPAQAGLTGKQRRQNLQGAFCLLKPLPYSRLAIIDDVVTTRSSLLSLQRALRISASQSNKPLALQAWCLASAQQPKISTHYSSHQKRMPAAMLPAP